MKVRFENNNNPIFSFTEKEIPPSMSVGVRVVRAPRAKAGFRDFYGFVNFYLNRNELWVWKVHETHVAD